MTDVPVVSPAEADPSRQVILHAGIRWRPVSRAPLVLNPKACVAEPPDSFVPSLAISVAEDPISDRDCTIASYVKVTLTISSWRRPTGGQQGQQTLPGPSVWGCYGAVLRLAVNPYSTEVPPADYPVFTDFEPQMRDLFQGGSIENEVLSGSTGQTTVDRASKSISSTTVGLSVTGGYGGSQSVGPNISATGSISGTRSLEQDYDFSTVSGVSSSKRNATSDTISQMYNLLTGYHSGTNCCDFAKYLAQILSDIWRSQPGKSRRVGFPCEGRVRGNGSETTPNTSEELRHLPLKVIPTALPSRCIQGRTRRSRNSVRSPISPLAFAQSRVFRRSLPSSLGPIPKPARRASRLRHG